ncbi:restriction endonuclease subunit S [Acinetobacter nectaris]|uniref:restriction endonuclease subunit S n=1 Tax=Acinetobacter nectaris TaxID=1219382 RepID=UPI001F3DC427|nr:restriction endonuclease subunit S [Acinetobacter nectaris]MCF8999835.1 restriction endonuclease subunit S [Acinetobacter nectaris]MCF9026748.1 restriction endonuclease subunit S [Acinetobacter nectaris]
METKLKNIAEIYTGFTQRPPNPDKSVNTFDLKTIQIKDLIKDQVTITNDQLSEIEWAYDSKPQFLKHNSLIVVARGEPNAYIFKGNIQDQVAVSNQFIVVNLNTDILKPEYLAWYFNHSQAMRSYFEMNSRGSMLMMLSISILKEASIIIPSLDQQHEIHGLLNESMKDKTIVAYTQRLMKLRAEYNQAKCEQILLQAQTVQ